MSYVCKNDDFPRAFLPKKGRIRAAPADTQTRSVYLQTMISSFDTKDTSEKEEAVKGDRGAGPKKYCVKVTQQKPSSLPARLYEFSAIIFPLDGNGFFRYPFFFQKEQSLYSLVIGLFRLYVRLNSKGFN